MIKALGQQDQVQLFTIVNYFIVGLVCAYVIGVKLGHGIDGLWYGIGTGITLNAIGYSGLPRRQEAYPDLPNYLAAAKEKE